MRKSQTISEQLPPPPSSVSRTRLTVSTIHDPRSHPSRLPRVSRLTRQPSCALFQAHLLSESQGLLRHITATREASAHSHASLRHSKKRSSATTTGARKVFNPDTSLPSSVFDCGNRRANKNSRATDEGGNRGRGIALGGDGDSSADGVIGNVSGGAIGTSGTTLDGGSCLENPSLRAARMDAQYRLRLTPAAMWGERARRAEAQEAEKKQNVVRDDQPSKSTFVLATGVMDNGLGRGRDRVGGGAGGGGKKNGANFAGGAGGGLEKHSANFAGAAADDEKRAFTPFNSGGVLMKLPVGRSDVQAASLKRPGVTESVPLRWQSKLVAFSSLRDRGEGGAPPRALMLSSSLLSSSTGLASRGVTGGFARRTKRREGRRAMARRPETKRWALQARRHKPCMMHCTVVSRCCPICVRRLLCSVLYRQNYYVRVVILRVLHLE